MIMEPTEKNQQLKKFSQIEPDASQVSAQHATTLSFSDFIENKGDLWSMDKYPVSWLIHRKFIAPFSKGSEPDGWS